MLASRPGIRAPQLRLSSLGRVRSCLRDLGRCVDSCNRCCVGWCFFLNLKGSFRATGRQDAIGMDEGGASGDVEEQEESSEKKESDGRAVGDKKYLGLSRLRTG